ncbi:site-specific integrase [Fibrisoma montanum]|uniref:Site-specific integrase n=1 Tax=Fibrisoma montanum TaxID=2305895 RepID=A0A418ME59_9BACT|nr:site-specific integrase [Fibrisoma montanum]RIV25094.1 site-specific integrase [Fibrisoma montanum]
MKVTLREKPISDARKSLYLDFYPPIPHPETGKPTRREFLGLYIFEKPRTELDRRHNKETKLLAQNICAGRQLEVQAGNYGFLKKKLNVTTDFLQWFKDQADKRFKTNQTKARGNWLCVYHHLHIFSNGRLPVDAVTESFCRQFKEYLLTAKNLNTQRLNNQTISYSTAVGYFIIFKTAIKRAVQDGVLASNVGEKVKPYKPKAAERTFLSLAELQAIAKTDCDIPQLKRAGLFSALTGLRYSDIEKMTWSEVYDDANGPYIRFIQRKTQETETLPLSSQARALLGERGRDAERVFPHLLYSSHQNNKLQQWATSAGINRPITFHAFRHTFATLQLQNGTDIYTVSKLLGHQDLATTQIYARIVNEQKRAAVDRIKLDM